MGAGLLVAGKNVSDYDSVDDGAVVDVETLSLLVALRMRNTSTRSASLSWLALACSLCFRFMAFFDLLGTLLLLVLQCLLDIMKGLDLLQQITPPLHGGCLRSSRTARLGGWRDRRGRNGRRGRRRVGHTGLSIRDGTSGGVDHGADRLTNKPKGVENKLPDLT